MIRKAEDMRVTSAENLKGGRGAVVQTHILEAGEMHGTGRLFSKTVLAPGCSVGEHVHQGDFETYFILKGRARVTDNGTVYELGPGDMNHCADGDSHSIENIGSEDLEFVAVIQYSEIHKD